MGPLPGSADLESPPAILERIAGPGDGRAVHLIRIVHRGDQYTFDPPELVIPPGDVVRFVMTGSQPESIVFDPSEATPAAAAFIRSSAIHVGVLLTDPGQAYDVTFREAPAGMYPYYSIPHATQGMRGRIVVQE